MDKKTKGNMGESAVCDELIKRGHTILERNYRKPFGEIDIISSISGFIVFTEVKTRKHGSMVSGLDAVDSRKQKKIVLTADAYLSEHDFGLQPRYDIAEVAITRGENARVLSIHIYEDAFSADGIYTVN